MNAHYRHPEPAIDAWLSDGPVHATADSRRAIAAAVRGTRQRRSLGPIELARQSRLIAAAALLVALAALAISAGGLRLILPSPAPTPSALPAPRIEAVLDRVDRRIPFSYQLPETLDVDLVKDERELGLITFASEGGARWLGGGLDAIEPGAHGVTVADVTGATEHGSLVVRPVFGATADAFLRGLDASAYFVVEDVKPATVGGLAGWSARVRPEGNWFTHIDIYPPGDRIGSVEFSTPNVTWITDVGDAVVAVEVWADTPETLAGWLPRAMQLVESIRFEQPTAD